MTLISTRLIYDCDFYYNALKENRKMHYKKYYSLKKDSIMWILERKNKMPSNLRNSDYYQLRGSDYFNVQDFHKAILDFDSSEYLDKNLHGLNMYYKGQIAEILEEYDEAIKDYEISSKVLRMFLIQEYADILKRKK